MVYTLHDASVPLLIAGLNTLLNLLNKVEAHAAEKSVDPKTLLEAKLAEDMFPFTFQYHVATDSAMKIIARVQGTDPEVFDNKFESVADLRARVEHTLALVKAADPKTFEERTDALVPLGLGFGKGEMQIRARDYLVAYGLPNFFFHIQAAYSILRKEGVNLGKADYLGPFMGPFVEQHQKAQQ
ncbi:3-oxoacyl-acyl-carrier-protein synthase [Colletotrichum musicola]|uniref:3-oxoacyl-acyl-carrier-protein synthase n=2 Tax=Colletotrichum orchidearum species complex TaxID=2707337 RepID=A0A8H6NM60_9PEZI|nr:3-oxoacyl-acyl-carrier-protein synthase [Colletotrichum plurivorum]KAF6838519.1 3-oxoacyl-acyl-carrier-protein synthase [Colletotrichum musicola]